MQALLERLRKDRKRRSGDLARSLCRNAPANALQPDFETVDRTDPQIWIAPIETDDAATKSRGAPHPPRTISDYARMRRAFQRATRKSAAEQRMMQS
jgi:hypothetical protein